jgi:hypothetical protein
LYSSYTKDIEKSTHKPMLALTFPAIVILVGIHLLSRFVPLDRKYCRPWLSLGSGVSLAYVFTVLLPEISRYDNLYHQSFDSQESIFLENLMFVLALFGLLIFYALEQMVIYSKAKTGNKGVTTADIFSAHIISFAIHNFLIAYLLVFQETQSAFDLLLYTIAISLHILANDFSLRDHHKEQYDKYGRWIIVGAAIIGWVTSLVINIPILVASGMVAFLAGNLIFTIIKEEIPINKNNQLFWCFLTVLS